MKFEITTQLVVCAVTFLWLVKRSFVDMPFRLDKPCFYLPLAIDVVGLAIPIAALVLGIRLLHSGSWFFAPLAPAAGLALATGIACVSYGMKYGCRFGG